MVCDHQRSAFSQGFRVLACVFVFVAVVGGELVGTKRIVALGVAILLAWPLAEYDSSPHE